MKFTSRKSASARSRSTAASKPGDANTTMAFTHSDAIEVKRARGKGRGVFARRLIREGEVIERVPVIVLPLDEGDTGTVLPAYCFTWSRNSVALALGYGSLFNHSY